MILCCSDANDLLQVLRRCSVVLRHIKEITEALTTAEDGEAVILLADDYPKPTLEISQEMLDIVYEKHLRVYLEYPKSMPGLEIGEATPTEWERVVVASDWFAPSVNPQTILALHGCWYLPTNATDPHLVVARVAGYDTAVFGLPERQSPVLFQLPHQNILVATSKLSQFITARYGPTPAWKTIWERILTWLDPNLSVDLHWQLPVSVTAGAIESLPNDIERTVLERSFDWYQKHVIFSIAEKKGAIEGFESTIDYLGRQFPRTWTRGDCVAESAMVLAYAWTLNGNPYHKWLAGKMLDYVWSSPEFFHDDPTSPLYGLNNWYERGQVFYGDDNARVILPTLTAGRLLDDDRWDERVLRCILANLRTTGPQGFREWRLDYPQSFTEGKSWQYYRDHELIYPAPNYQAYPWACYLWLSALTGYEESLVKTERGLRRMMEIYPQWVWAGGFPQEQARMLLPLTFMVRASDTTEHREWLSRVADELLSRMDDCGAIREGFGPEGLAYFPPPSSNEAYGGSEYAVIQNEGDTACDLLYTMNYAFIGFHEAYRATGEQKYRDAETRIADFLCRIQNRSQQHPYLDGTWMRSFDYRLWEYWGSSADAGWGAWCVESGWMNSWIASTLAMRHLGEGLFDLTIAERLQRIFPKIHAEMEVETDCSQWLGAETELGSRPGAQ